MAVAEPLIRVRGAAFRYGERDVFTDLDLDVYAGEVLSILGPNGCGKTTLLRCIGGALTLAAGSVLIDGTDVASLGGSARARQFGFLFQEHTPSFPFSVIDVVTMGRSPHLGPFETPGRTDIERAHQALERVGVAQLARRAYTLISGGERQLVLLARVLAQEPRVILLDEPTSHLDFRHQALTLKMIRSLAGRGMTMIVTTHDPNHAFVLDGRAALMTDGRFVTVGPSADVMTEATLSETYGLDVAIVSVSRAGQGSVTLCSPWLR